MRGTGKGILLLILSAFFFALMGLFVREAGDVPFLQKTLFRNIVALCAALLVLKRDAVCIPKGALRWLFLRSAAGTAGLFGNFYAIDRIALADAALLNKLSPFFALVFSWPLLKERIKPLPFFAILGALCGAALVVKPGFHGGGWFAPTAGFLGGVSAGLAYACVRKLKFFGVDGAFIVAFFSAFSTCAVLPFVVFSFHPMTLVQTAWLLGAGFAAAGGQFCITAAYFAAPASKIGVFDYSQLLFSALMGYFAFGQVPDTLSWIGYAIIVAMALLVYSRK